MRSRVRWMAGGAVVLVLVLVLVGGLIWWRVQGSGAGYDLTAPGDVEDVAAAITDAVPAAMRDAHVPGAAVAIARDGKAAWSRTFGVPAGTVFQAGSISKTVAAATILTLVREGTLDLDAPVSRYLTSWHLPAGSPAPEQVTLRRLLSHTAGIDTDGYLGLPAGQPLPSTAASLAGASTGRPVRQTGQPGSYSYSGGGFTIAQQVVEDVTGEPFPAVVRREVLEPLGMHASGYGCTEAAEPGPHDAAGHLASGSPAPRYRYAEAAAAGLCTTADDLATFAGWLASSDPRAEQLRQPEDGTQGKYGLGLELINDHTVGHPGVNRGFHAELLADPGARVGLVVLTDGDRGGDVVDSVLKAWSESDGS